MKIRYFINRNPNINVIYAVNDQMESTAIAYSKTATSKFRRYKESKWLAYRTDLIIERYEELDRIPPELLVEPKGVWKDIIDDTFFIKEHYE